MTRCFTACLIALSLAAGLSAQYPEQKPADKQMPSKSPQTVTIAGCVREGDTPNSFFLANVDPTALAAQHSTGATGTSGMPPAPAGSAATASNTTTVLLISTADIDLSKHVGHKVEVTGMVAPTKGEPAKPGTGAAGTAGTPTTDTTARAAEKDTDKSKAHAHKLTVRSVKHISETCSM
ncbi:MAG: hypothetical protein ACRD09_13515 [Vicinamibacterales bacterium]